MGRKKKDEKNLKVLDDYFTDTPPSLYFVKLLCRATGKRKFNVEELTQFWAASVQDINKLETQSKTGEGKKIIRQSKDFINTHTTRLLSLVNHLQAVVRDEILRREENEECSDTCILDEATETVSTHLNDFRLHYHLTRGFESLLQARWEWHKAEGIDIIKTFEEEKKE